MTVTFERILIRTDKRLSALVILVSSAAEILNKLFTGHYLDTLHDLFTLCAAKL